MAASPQTPLLISDIESDFDGMTYENEMYKLIATKKSKKGKESRKKPKTWKFKVPTPPSKSSPPGPAYSPQTFTFLSYKQYFANLTHINNDFVKDRSPNPNSLSHNQDINAPNNTIFGLAYDPLSGAIEPAKWKEGKHGKHQGKRPHPKPHPKKFKYEVEYDTKHDKLFKLKDLTVRSYVELARRIGRDKAGVKGAEFEVEAEGGKEDNEEWSDSEKSSGEYDSDIEVEDDVEDTDDIEDTDNIEDTDANPPSASNKDKKHKKGKKKKGKKGKHGPKHNGAWFTFVKRAFVGTMDPAEIEDLFLASELHANEGGEDTVNGVGAGTGTEL